MKGLAEARYQAKRSFKRRISEKETHNPAIIAKVGNGAGTVVVPGRSGWIYVRLHGNDNQLAEAKLGIPLDTDSLNDAWVRVKKASPRKASYYVVQEFVTSGTGNPAPPMSAHPLDPDSGPHTGALTEDDVLFDDVAGHDHQGAGDTGKKVGHGSLTGVTADQHHAQDHHARHEEGGADQFAGHITIPRGKEFRPGGDANTAFGEDGSGNAYLKDAVVGTKTLNQIHQLEGQKGSTKFRLVDISIAPGYWAEVLPPGSVARHYAALLYCTGTPGVSPCVDPNDYGVINGGNFRPCLGSRENWFSGMGAYLRIYPDGNINAINGTGETVYINGIIVWE